MSKLIVGLYAETFLHPGSGQNEGAIDLPVMRERATGYPVVLGSSLKGALRAKACGLLIDNRLSETKINDYFGQEEGAGGILVGDARLLLLPIRSLTGSFKWVTCPHVLRRLKRDLARCEQLSSTAIPNVAAGHYASAERRDLPAAGLYLEERLLDISPQRLDAELLKLIGRILPSSVAMQELHQRLVVVHDDDFSWFAGNGLPVHARNKLEKETKHSENLWYEETLPPETLLYTVLLPRFNPELMSSFQRDLFYKNAYLQLGGNETIGQGWVEMAVCQHDPDNNEAEA